MSPAALLPLKMFGAERLADSLGPRHILGSVRREVSFLSLFTTKITHINRQGTTIITGKS